VNVKTLGERVVEVARKELLSSVTEEPIGSNTGRRIREYLAPCRRRGSEKLLNLNASNWCMAFVSWCQSQALEDGEVPAHGYRAAVLEAVADVLEEDKFSGVWSPVKSVIEGSWTPKVGDLAVYDRSISGRPSTAWWRHVDIVSKLVGDGGTYLAIGGNQGNKVSELKRSCADRKLLGFISYPDEKEEAVAQAPLVTEEEKTYIFGLSYIVADEIVKKYVWGQPE
jgi:hypothetical protein